MQVATKARRARSEDHKETGNKLFLKRIRVFTSCVFFVSLWLPTLCSLEHNTDPNGGGKFAGSYMQLKYLQSATIITRWNFS